MGTESRANAFHVNHSKTPTASLLSVLEAIRDVRPDERMYDDDVDRGRASRDIWSAPLTPPTTPRAKPLAPQALTLLLLRLTERSSYRLQFCLSITQSSANMPVRTNGSAPARLLLRYVPSGLNKTDPCRTSVHGPPPSQLCTFLLNLFFALLLSLPPGCWSRVSPLPSYAPMFSACRDL